MAATTFTHENKTYTVDTVNQPGLWRQNAMTLYQFARPFIIVASEVDVLPNVGITSGAKLFYLIFTRESNWLQVDMATGDNLMITFQAGL